MALIGSISINMSVRTAALVAGMKKASKAVAGFGVKATAGVQSFGAGIASAGRATAGVVDQFYIKPLFRVADAATEVGKEVGKSLAWAGKGLSGPMAGMAAGAARMGKALTVAGLKGAAVGLRAVGSAAKYAGNAFVSTFRFAEQLGAKLAIIGGVGAFGLYRVAKAASTLGEQVDRTRILFGKGATADIVKQANVMGEAFGVARGDFVAAAAGIGGQAKGLGYAADEAAKLGAEMAKLAVNTASGVQLTNAEALEKMSSAVAGEVRAVREWGLDLSEANLKIQAVNKGIARQGVELTQAQKVQTRISLTWEKLAYLQNNLGETANSAENAAKGLMGRLNNLAETVGTALLPIVGSALTELNVGVQALSMAWTDWTRGTVSESLGVIGSNQEIANSIGWVQKAIGGVADAWQDMSMVFSFVQSYVTSGFGKLVGWVAKLGDAIGYLVSKVTGMPAAENVLKTWSEDLSRLSGEQYRRFEAKANARPASEGINAAFAASRDRINAMRKEAMKPGVDVTGFKPAATGAAKVGEPKFAKAAAVGSEEAANAVLRSRYGAGAGGKKPEEETARNTRRLVQLFDRIAMGNREPVEIKGLPSWQLAAGAGALAGNF